MAKKGEKTLMFEQPVKGGSLKLYRVEKSNCGSYRVAGPGFNRCYKTLYGARKGLQNRAEQMRA